MADLQASVFFGVLAMIGYGLATSLAKPLIKKEGVMRAVFYRYGIELILLGLIILAVQPKIVFSLNEVLLTLGLGVLGFFAVKSFYKAINTGKLGVVSPLANTHVLFTILLAVALFGESLTAVQGFYILIIIAGAVLLEADLKHLKKSLLEQGHGKRYALIASVFWGVLYALLKIPVLVLGPLMTAFLLEASIFASAGAYLKKKGKKLTLPGHASMTTMFWIAVLVVMAIVAFNTGVSVGSVSVVAALMGANPIISTAYARIFLKEKLSRQQYFASALVIAGVVLLSL